MQARNGRAPIRWGGPVPEQADPTGGRHAFDAEAALTPIFTTLRRSGWAAQPQIQPPPAPRPVRPLRPVPDRVENFRDDPWTAPIPVVPPLHVVPDPVPPPSAVETTMMWHTVDGPADGYGYEPAPYEAAPYEPAGYDPAVYDLAPYEPYSQHEPYQPVPQGRRPYDAGEYDSGDYESGGYEPVGYYNPVTDTGRHHVRLAPAGW